MSQKHRKFATAMFVLLFAGLSHEALFTNEAIAQDMFQPFNYGPGIGPADVEAIRQHNLRIVMGNVGAQPSEAEFVLNRMSAVWNADKAGKDADRLLGNICNDFPQACQGLRQ